jgi:hypothetical protein
VAATLGVSMALFDDNRTIVAGIDATPDGLAAMKAGELKVTVFQNASGQGKSAVDMALKLVAGGKVEERVWVPFELVTSANLANYLNKHWSRTLQPGTDLRWLRFLEVRNVCKAFPGVIALDDVFLRVEPTTVHAVMGENGARLNPEDGCRRWSSSAWTCRGQPIRLGSPRQALESGIAMIHQELNLVPFMTVAENIWSLVSRRLDPGNCW